MLLNILISKGEGSTLVANTVFSNLKIYLLIGTYKNSAHIKYINTVACPVHLIPISTCGVAIHSNLWAYKIVLQSKELISKT